MDSLCSVERDGERYFCFIDVCTVFFHDVSKSTVRSWLKILNIPCEVCTHTERSIFRVNNPLLTGSFGMISKKGLTRLLEHRAVKDVRSPFELSSPRNLTECGPRSLVEYVSSSDEEQTQFTPKKPNIAEVEERGESSQNYLNTSFHNELELDESLELGECSGEMECNRKRKKRCRDAYKLSEEEQSPDLRREIVEIRRFYTSPINSKRSGCEVTTATWNKMLERILCYLGYLKKHKNIASLSLQHCSDENLVSDYIKYLQDVRKLMPSTVSSILTVIINVVKYNLRDDQILLHTSEQLACFRAVQRQLARQARFVTKKAKEGMTKKSSQQFYFSLILETLRNLHRKHAESRGGIEKARFLHDFVLISLYISAMPGRSQDIRSLKLIVASPAKPFTDWESASGNVIVFAEDSRIYLVQNEHKTIGSLGPTQLELTDDEDLCRHLRMYLNIRTKLLHGNSHNSFFVNSYGEPFSGSSAISKYLGDLFEREVSIRASTNKLRHAIVTYFYSLDESKDISARESLAALMKHSVRYQASVYDDNTYHDKTMLGRELLRSKVSSEVFGEGDEAGNSTSSDESQESDDQIRPRVNDICALLDPASTENHVNFFLAKVARYTPDGKEAHLIHLEPVEDSSNMYRVKPGLVWRESVRSLIYPVDIVFNAAESAYEMRTSAESIYAAVRRK